MTVSFEEAEKIRAEYRKMLAEKEAKKETKAKLPDESVSSSKSEQGKKDLEAQGGKPPQGSPQEAEFKVEGKSLEDAAEKITSKYEDKPKKKRGRPKKKKD